MGELPHIKALVERHDSSEFAVFGVNTDVDPDHFRKRCEEEGVTWPNLFAGDPGGDIPQSWGVNAYPTMYLLDGEGVIRAVDIRGKDIERMVDDLVAEAGK